MIIINWKIVFYIKHIWIQVNDFLKHQSENSKPMTVEEVAMGFIRVANESMCRPIRALTQVYYINKYSTKK